MIVRDRPSSWRLFFVLRGSIMPKVAPQIAAVMAVAVLATAFHEVLVRYRLTFTAVPFTIIGLALSIFLGFRNSAAYDRYWEGRRLWGELVITSRIMARQLISLVGYGPLEPAVDVTDLRRRMIYLTIGFAHALRHHLRGTESREDLAPLLEAAELSHVVTAASPPQEILRRLGADLRLCLAAKLLGEPLAANLDKSLSSLDHVLGSCERIKSTPIPFSYSLLLHRTAYLYCFLLPLGLIDTVGMATPLVAGLVSYTFFGLDALGDEIEEPFGTSPNDLPLTALCRNVEIDLRTALGEVNLPEPLMPVRYVLV